MIIHAPSFAEVAQRPDLTLASLYEYLAYEHPYQRMPYPHLAAKDLDSVVAYILKPPWSPLNARLVAELTARGPRSARSRRTSIPAAHAKTSWHQQLLDIGDQPFGRRYRLQGEIAQLSLLESRHRVHGRS